MSSRPDVARRQQAAASVIPTPLVTGGAGDRLGTGLTSCEDGLVIATAPGRHGYWLSDGGSAAATIAPTAELGVAACDWSLILAGDGGFHRLFPPGQWLTLTPSATWVVATRPGLPTLFSGTPKVVLAEAPDAGVAMVLNLNSVLSTPITALAWINDSQYLVGVAGEGRVLLADWPSATARDLFDGGVPGAGRAFAVGDVWWHDGTEFLVGAQGKVMVFASDAGFIDTLIGTHPSFGSAIAVGPSGFDLDQVWIGEPELHRVWAFVGDAGQVSDAFEGRFGASLARSGRTLYIGAPSAFDGGGGLWKTSNILPSFLSTVVQACSPGSCPVQNCSPGGCIGGVLCSYSGLGFCDDGGLIDLDGGTLIDGGLVDGGLVDGGLFDAGAGDAGAGDAGAGDGGAGDGGAGDGGAGDGGAGDAGTGDAGAEDAGADDAGAGAAGARDAGAGDGGAGAPVRFVTRGCSAAGWSPLLVAALALVRRRRVRPS